MSTTDKPTKIVKRTKAASEPIEIKTPVPDIDTILDNAKSVIAKTLVHLQAKVNRGAPLDPNETQQLQKYISSLLDIKKDKRDQEQHDEKKKIDLTDEELEQEIVRLVSSKKKRSKKCT